MQGREIIVTVYLSSHLDVSYTVVNRDEGDIPELSKSPRHHRGTDQRSPHPWSLRVAYAVYIRDRHSRFLEERDLVT